MMNSVEISLHDCPEKESVLARLKLYMELLANMAKSQNNPPPPGGDANATGGAL